MIHPRDQWCTLIDITNDCNRKCSNCTRLVGHGSTFYMSLDQFENAATSLSGFVVNSPPSKSASPKLVGLIGGEPLLHPQFVELLQIFREKIPNKSHRGLWTGLNWQKSRYAQLISDTFETTGIHNNRHDLQNSVHSPVLVASQDVIDNSTERSKIINNCWLQKKWCGSITPKGHFFCEVAGAFDWVFNGPGGLPVIKNGWDRPLQAFQSQIDQWCNRCGIALQLPGRNADEEWDDISLSNLQHLKNVESLKVREDRFTLFDRKEPTHSSTPWVYQR